MTKKCRVGHNLTCQFCLSLSIHERISVNGNNLQDGTTPGLIVMERREHEYFAERSLSNLKCYTS